MAGSVLKFSFEVIGETRDDVLAELDNVCNEIILNQGGEPWVVVQDEVKKQAVSTQALLANDAAGIFYHGTRAVLFTGPTKLGQGVDYHDGFRPQQDEPPSF